MSQHKRKSTELKSLHDPFVQSTSQSLQTYISDIQAPLTRRSKKLKELEHEHEEPEQTSSLIDYESPVSQSLHIPSSRITRSHIFNTEFKPLTTTISDKDIEMKGLIHHDDFELKTSSRLQTPVSTVSSIESVSNTEEVIGLKKIEKVELPIAFKYILLLEPSVSRLAFKDKAYDFKLSLFDTSTKSVTTNHHTRISLQVISSDTGAAMKDANSFITTNPRELIIGETGILEFSAFFNEFSSKYKNIGHKLLFFIMNEESRFDLSSSEKITPENCKPLLTGSINVVCKSEVPSLWFKDEGGRENYFRVYGNLVDSNDNPVPNNELKLIPYLGYFQSDKLAPDQTILRYKPSSLVVDKNGIFNLYFRIEEVSKNHNKQSFVIYIQPDPSATTNFDIGPAVSTPIKVKSKRNKKKELVSTSRISAKPVTAPQSTLPLKIAPLKLAEESYPNISAPLPTDAPSAPTTTETRSISESLPTASFTRETLPTTQTYGIIDMSAEIAACANWSKKVYDILSNNLEWQVVAYELIDSKSMPIFRCPACFVYRDTMRNYNRSHENDCVLRDILTSYNLEIRNKLQRLEDYTLNTTINMPIPYSPLYQPSTIANTVSENISDTNNGVSTFSLMNVNPTDPNHPFDIASYSKDNLSMFHNQPGS